MFIKIFSAIGVLAFLIAVQAASVKEVKLLRFEDESSLDGTYKFAYEQSDGQKREDERTVIEIEGEEPDVTVRGSYSFIADDGKEYIVTYIADRNGFRAFGDHLPKDENAAPEEPVPAKRPENASAAYRPPSLGIDSKCLQSLCG